MQYIKLSNGVEMPVLGYGVFQVPPQEAERCVSDALSEGYRLIDTAQAYFNEEGVGEAVAKSGIKREDIFLVTKVCINPVCKVMTLNTRQNVLDELFGNTSFIPVGNVQGDNEYEDAVDDMFTNKSAWE